MKSSTSKGTSSAAKDFHGLFTGEFDYTNVTEFRESLLPLVSELESDPGKRYLVTKHGKPLAVFLSFDAFEAARRLVESVLAEEDKKSVPEILRGASQRMDREHGVHSEQAVGVSGLTTQIQAVHAEIIQLHSLMSVQLRKRKRVRQSRATADQQQSR